VPLVVYVWPVTAQVYESHALMVVVVVELGVIVNTNCGVTQFTVGPLYVPLAVYVWPVTDHIYSSHALIVVVVVELGVIVNTNCGVTQFTVGPL
jgi:hypothetical protein